MQRIGKVESRADRKALLNETLDYLEKNFKNRKNNGYFKGGTQNLYMRTFNRVTAPLYAGMIRLKGRTERQYL